MGTNITEAGSPTTVIKMKANPMAMFVGGLLMLFGGLSVFSIVGILWGLPMAIIGWLVSRKQKGLQGPCPHCETLVNIPLCVVGFNCPACAKRIIIRNSRFVPVV